MAELKNLSITLETKEIYYDVLNKAHLTGQAREAEGKDYRSAAYMQASDDDAHSYQIYRGINNAFAQLKVELGEYLNDDGTTANNRILPAVESKGQLSLSFVLPSNYHSAARDSLAAAAHEYIVDRTLSDWFVITDKTDAEDYVNLAAAALERAKQALYKRERPTRPSYT